MKRWNSMFKILFDAVLTACGMLACICAVPSAFMIPFSRMTLLIGCALAAVLLSAWMHLPRAGIVPGLVFLGGTFVYGIINRKLILFGFRWIRYALFDPLSRDFPMLPSVTAPALPDGADFTYISPAVTSALLILAAGFGLLLAFALVRGKMALLSVLVPLLPFLLSLIYTDQPPALWTAVLLTIYCGGALLGQGLRKNDSKRLGITLALLVPALALFTLLLIVCSPERSFAPIPFEQRKEMLGDRADAIGDTLLSMVRNNPKQYDLNQQEERKESDTKVFALSASRSGTFLLRTHSYGRYRDGVWQEADEYEGEWSSMTALGNHAGGQTVSLSIRDALTAERYVPYAFISDSSLRIGESYIRSASKTAYLWKVRDAVNLSSTGISQEERVYLEFAREQYTMPDGAEKERLLEIAKAAGLSVQGDAYQTARSVAAYVKNSGTYSLEPGKVPSDRDFVEYFLTESHVGYCVHFASATTALLQAMDVPARYTIGYRAVVSSPDTWTDVTERVAHAWVEVYLPGVGWIPVESTAGFSYEMQSTDRTQQPAATPKPTAVPTAVPTPELTATPAEQPIDQPTEQPTETPQATIGATALPTAPAKPAETPSIIGETNEPKPSERKNGGLWWLLVLLLPVLCGAWYGLGLLIRKKREESFLQKNPRKAVLAMLRYLKGLERYGVKRDPHAEEWEEEAAFSDHTMAEARKILLGRIKKAQSTLYREKPLLRFLVKWVLIAI